MLSLGPGRIDLGHVLPGSRHGVEDLERTDGTRLMPDPIIVGRNALKIEELAKTMPLAFHQGKVYLGTEEVSDEIRSETAGNTASKLAALPAVRTALLAWQRNYAQAPGLVADGRDMGTVVFPHAQVKIFLTASPEERAARRYKQLKEKGLDVNLADLAEEIRERDERDRTRKVAPLVPATSAIQLDTTPLTIEQVTDLVLQEVYRAFPELS